MVQLNDCPSGRKVGRLKLVTVYVNVCKAAPRFFFAGALHLTEDAAKKVAEGLKDCIGTFPIEVPEESLKS